MLMNYLLLITTLLKNCAFKYVQILHSKLIQHKAEVSV